MSSLRFTQSLLQSFTCISFQEIYLEIIKAYQRSRALRTHKPDDLRSQSFLTSAVERYWQYLSSAPACSSGTTISIQNFTPIKPRNSVSETLGRGASFALTHVNPATLYISRVPAHSTTPGHAFFRPPLLVLSKFSSLHPNPSHLHLHSLFILSWPLSLQIIQNPSERIG